MDWKRTPASLLPICNVFGHACPHSGVQVLVDRRKDTHIMAMPTTEICIAVLVIVGFTVGCSGATRASHWSANLWWQNTHTHKRLRHC